MPRETTNIDGLVYLEMAHYDTIVVGLGAAGLTAASTLAQAGLKVLGLEAMDRLGGRVHTVPFGDGVIELGAEWIHGTEHSRSYELATKNNVRLIDQHLIFKSFMSDGFRANDTIINELIAYIFGDEEDDEIKTNESLGQYLTKKITKYIKDEHPEMLRDKDFLPEFLCFAELLINNYDSSNSWNDLTAKSNYRQLEGHQHVSWHSIGYKTLFDILLNNYNNGKGLPTLTTKLNTEVSKISYSPGPSEKVSVTTTSGTTYSADNVIVTVSLGVLKAKHQQLFNPKLPEPKAAAINNLSIGVMDKIELLFEKPWWPSSSAFFGFLWKEEDKKKVPAEDYWTTQIFAASRPEGCKRALTLWTSGEVGKLVETLPEEVVKPKVMGLLRRFLGKGINVPEPIDMKRSTWYNNPHTRGSYSYDNLLTPQYPTSRADLAAPILDSAGNPRVLFAGEATDQNHFSTVHGAMDTGHREAMRLLERRTRSRL